jgi:hypothetical protein
MSRVGALPIATRSPGEGPSRHAASATDTAVLRVVLKVRDGPGVDYWWVGCGGCDRLAGSVYAESVG